MSEDGLDHGRKLPICLRKYESGNVECDGRARAHSSRDRMPCVYRDRCVGLQRLIKVSNVKASTLLKRRKVRDPDGRRRTYSFAIGDSDRFQQTLNRAIDRYGIRHGRVTIRHLTEEVPKKKRTIRNRSDASKARSTTGLKKARRFATKALKAKAADDLATTIDLLRLFIDRLEKKTRRKIVEREDALVGEFFVTDRIGSSKYVTVYCKTLKIDPRRNKRIEARRPIVSVILLARTHSLQFKLPVDPKDYGDALSEKDLGRVSPETFDEGRFKCKTGPMDREGSLIVADSIANAIKKGTIPVPGIVDEKVMSLIALADWFVSKVVKKSHVGLDVVDMMEAKRSVVVCCVNNGKRGKPIVSVTLSPGSNGLIFRLPFAPEGVGVSRIDVGAFKYKTSPLARDGASSIVDAIAARFEKESLDDARELFDWFVSRVSKRGRRPVGDDREDVVIGGLFVVDKIDLNGTAVIYCKTSRKGRRPIVSATMVPRSQTIQFGLPFDPEGIGSKSSIEERRLVFKTDPVERDRATVIADSVAVVIRKGIMKLPKVVLD